MKSRSSRIPSNRSGIGGNYPPDGIDDSGEHLIVADPAQINDLLSRRCAGLEQRRDDLIAGIERWKEAHVNPGRNEFLISGKDDCRDVVDFLDQIKQFRTKQVEPERKRCKAPWDEAIAAVQGYFIRLADDVEAAAQPVQAAYVSYLTEEEEEQRRDMRIAAASHAQEAQRLTAQADRALDQAMKDTLYEQARLQQERADALFHTAETATAAELTHIRGDFGSIGGLKTTWEWETESLMDLVMAVVHGQESVDVLTVNATVVNAMVKKGGRQKIQGLRIYPVKKGR